MANTVTEAFIIHDDPELGDYLTRSREAAERSELPYTELVKRDQWQDIATAPKDGTTILGYTATGGADPHFYHPIYFHDGHWHEQGIDGALVDGWYTHWQPLTPPTLKDTP